MNLQGAPFEIILEVPSEVSTRSFPVFLSEILKKVPSGIHLAYSARIPSEPPSGISSGIQGILRELFMRFLPELLPRLLERFVPGFS